MTQGDGIGPGSMRGPIRMTWRRSREATQATVLSLALIIVFLLSIAHDEIVEALVAQGWLQAGLAERAEIVLGLFLFVIWGALTVALVDLFRKSAQRGGRSGQGGGA
jgi:flagellar biosynthesis protein FlhB